MIVRGPDSWSKSAAVRQQMLNYDPTLLHHLSSDEQAELLNGLESLVGGERPTDFISRIWPDEPAPRHVLPIIDAVEQARVTPIRVCIDIGPGHAKTTILLRLLIWWLCRSPADQCAYVTYSSGQAHDKSSVAIGYGEDAGLQFAANSHAKGHWHTQYGGGLIAAGARGKLTGQRVPGLILYDDPYKSESEARSAAINTEIKSRFKGVAFTRLQGGSIFVLHTRYSDDDLIGWILRELKWDSIHIPTFGDEKDDIIGRKILTRDQYVSLSSQDRGKYGLIDAKHGTYGEVAWPEKYPYEICTTPCGHDGHLREIRATIGEHLWAAMYQGRPRPLGKAVFHEPGRYRLHDDPTTGAKSEFSWTRKRGVIMADTAASAATSSDWTVLLVLAMSGLGIESRMWIVDCIRVQEEVPEVITIMRRLQLRYRLMVGIETVAANASRAISQMIRRSDPKLRILDVEVGGRDKFARAIPVSAAWNQGRVLVPIDAPWADTLIDEHKKFTGVSDVHDDQVDADAHGWNVLYKERPKITAEDYVQDSGM